MGHNESLSNENNFIKVTCYNNNVILLSFLVREASQKKTSKGFWLVQIGEEADHAIKNPEHLDDNLKIH